MTNGFFLCRFAQKKSQDQILGESSTLYSREYVYFISNYQHDLAVYSGNNAYSILSRINTVEIYHSSNLEKKEAALLHRLGAAIPNFPKFVHTGIVL